jgi:ABC-2 type transport system permease protein
MKTGMGSDPGRAKGVEPGSATAYLSCFRLRLLQNLQYRVAAIAGLATQFFWGFMLILILEAFTKNSGAPLPMSMPQMASYIWLQQSFLVFAALWFRDTEMFGLITTGNVAYELCRPTNLYFFWYVRLLASRMAGAALRCGPILLVAMLLPHPYRLLMPKDPGTLLVFLVALLLGVLVNVGISMFIYILTFVTLNHTGSLLLIGTFGEFLAGLILPVPLMPLWLQRIVHVLPFRLAADLPFRIWSGHIPLQEAFPGILTQLVWLAVLLVTGQAAMQRVLRRVVVQGG